MKAMVLEKIKPVSRTDPPLTPVERPIPIPGPDEVLVKISACGVCHTELDEIEGRTAPPRLPIIPGHQAVGRVEATGPGAVGHKVGDRVGIGWINYSCGQCRFCREGEDNLCPEFQATGRDRDGGYAQYLTVKQDFAFPLPDVFSDAEAAPLLCAGAIGYRSLRLTGISDGQNLGLTGFGASGHLVLKMVRKKFPRVQVFVLARGPEEREFSLELGAAWAGDFEETPPEKMHAVIDTTPVWKPVVAALKILDTRGRLVINAIRKEEHDKNVLLDLDYPSQLWMEKEIKSVANVARRDIAEFLALAAAIPIKPEYVEYPLADANQALLELKERKIRGAKVLKID
ncbi:MAG: zinc-dependent alcohol dehydrogenase family protein [Pseudomonadota bacterium]